MTLLLLIVGLLWWRVPPTVAADTVWPTYCNAGYQKYPCDAVSYLKMQPAGNVFSAFEWGGFLIWQMPEFKVFVDGRTPAWTSPLGESPYTTYLKIIQAQPGWSQILDQYHTNYLLIPQGSFLDLLLQKEAASYGYKEEYRDALAVVYSHSSVIPAKAGIQ